MNAPIPPPEIAVSHRVFVFGGAYGNLQATHAMLDTARTLGFASNEVVFSGDSVAYCGQPRETVQLIRDSGIHALMGNCEEALATGSDNCGCGFETGSTCDALSEQWYSFCHERIGPDERHWMAGLPRSIALQIGRHRLLCTHATPESINRFIFASDTSSNTNPLASVKEYDGIVVGHSGIPFLATLGGKAWINSGAAGMPANDGTPRVWYAIIESRETCLTAAIAPIEYDHQTAARKMTEAGLPNGYRDCLQTGLWPSLDILPEMEKSCSGIPIEPRTLTIRMSDAGSQQITARPTPLM